VPINWRTDYGIRLVFELAKLGDGTRATVRELSETSNVPYDYARTIMRDLVRAGILTSRRGVGGGVELARSAADICVLDVFRAMNEPASLALCTDAGGECGRMECCPMHNIVWQEMDDVISRHLAATSFDKIVTLGRELEGNAS
jgi:Rrf2 family protein